MSIWMLTVIGTAVGGALLVWHMVTRTKIASEHMLRQYTQMLAEAREERVRKLIMEVDEKEPPAPPANGLHAIKP